MSYTGLVHWYVGVQGAPSRPTVRQVDRVSAPRASGRPTGGAEAGQQGAGGITLSYGGLVGWYTAVRTTLEPQATARVAPSLARPTLPHAA